MRRNPSPAASRHPLLDSTLFRTLGYTLIALQLLAFWMVCSMQVSAQRSRLMDAQVQQTAFSDCLQYVVDSTIGNCTTRLGRSAAMPTPDNAAAPQAGAVTPVGARPAVSVAAR